MTGRDDPECSTEKQRDGKYKRETRSRRTNIQLILRKGERE